MGHGVGMVLILEIGGLYHYFSRRQRPRLHDWIW